MAEDAAETTGSKVKGTLKSLFTWKAAKNIVFWGTVISLTGGMLGSENALAYATDELTKSVSNVWDGGKEILTQGYEVVTGADWDKVQEGLTANMDSKPAP